MWMENHYTLFCPWQCRDAAIVFHGVGVFLQQHKKPSSVAAFNNGRKEQISQREIRSLCGRHHGQVNSSRGDIYHQTYCFAAAEREEGGG